MKPTLCIGAALALLLGGCATAPPAQEAALDAPVVGVAAVASPSTSATLSSGLNTTTTERVIVAQPAAAPGTR